MNMNIVYLLILIPTEAFRFKQHKYHQQIDPKNLSCSEIECLTPIKQLMHDKIEAINGVRDFDNEIAPMDHMFDDMMDMTSGASADELLQGILCLTFLIKYQKYLKKDDTSKSTRSTRFSGYIFWASVLVNFLRNIHPVV